MNAFTIDRNIWYRGHSTGSMLLRLEDGGMCCVGIYLEACGVPRAALKDHAAAHCVDVPLPDDAKWLRDFNKPQMYNDSSAAAGNLYLCNDDPVISEPDREAQVAAGFAAQGVTVTFVN